MTAGDLPARSDTVARAPFVIATAILAAVAISLPVSDVVVANIPGFSAAWIATLCGSASLTTLLLLGQYVSGGGPRLLILSWAFVLQVAVMVYYALSVPGIISETPTFATGESTQWFWLASHVGPSLFIAAALGPWSAGLEARLSRDRHRRRTSGITVVGAVALAVLMGLLIDRYSRDWPAPLGPSGHYLDWVVSLALVVNLSAVAIATVGIISRGPKNTLESWAIVSVVACLADVLLTLLYEDQFTVAYYLARILSLAGSLIIVVAILAQIDGLHNRARSDAQRLEAQNDALVEAQALRDHLTAVVSHELRTPLAGLLGYLEMLQGDERLAPGHVQRMHERSWLLARRLALLTEDLLAVATSQHHDLVIVPEPLDVRQQLLDCATVFPDLDLIIDCPAELRLEADSLRLQQILGNLIRNAQKHGLPPVRLVAAAAKGGVTIKVSDAGPGIDPTFVPHVFDRYTQDGPHSTGGSGLGLSVVRDLVLAHRGRVVYDEEANTFVLFLPTPSPLVRTAALSRA